jgi:nucleotide-binding universal stress UspA family protein
MTYAAILVHVQAGEEGQPRLGRAAALAKSFDATLIGLAAEMIPPLVPGHGSIQGGWYDAMRESVELNLENARKAFDAATAGLTKPVVWESGMRVPTKAMADASRAADLIVANSAAHRHDDSYRDASSAELVVTSGRPVLIVPPREAKLVGEGVVLAWKDTREARRAMADAMPFFQRARRVLVLELCVEEEIRDSTVGAEDVAGALRRHGVLASSKVVRAPANGLQILHEAKAFGADLVVAGGYGHSRLGEWVFGGVTQDLLEQEECHVLLSH